MHVESAASYALIYSSESSNQHIPSTFVIRAAVNESRHPSSPREPRSSTRVLRNEGTGSCTFRSPNRRARRARRAEGIRSLWECLRPGGRAYTNARRRGSATRRDALGACASPARQRAARSGAAEPERRSGLSLWRQ